MVLFTRIPYALVRKLQAMPIGLADELWQISIRFLRTGEEPDYPPAEWRELRDQMWKERKQ